MTKVQVDTVCPNCNTELSVDAEVDTSSIETVPNVRAGIKPISSIQVYRITSEDMAKFITKISKEFVPEAKVIVAPRYCEKKRTHKNEPHRSYASLRIAFSDNVINRNNDNGWFGKIGESDATCPVVKSLYEGVIQKYQYNRKDIDKWLSNYKNLEELEENLGMTENYINDIKMYAIPKLIPTNNKERWVIFSAAAENVIAHMLQDPATGKVPGTIQIQDIYPITKDVVEFIVYLHPKEIISKEDPTVRKILLGEEKRK